jgi:hypothetical protein
MNITNRWFLTYVNQRTHKHSMELLPINYIKLYFTNGTYRGSFFFYCPLLIIIDDENLYFKPLRRMERMDHHLIGILNSFIFNRNSHFILWMITLYHSFT